MISEDPLEQVRIWPKRSRPGTKACIITNEGSDQVQTLDPLGLKAQENTPRRGENPIDTKNFDEVSGLVAFLIRAPPESVAVHGPDSRSFPPKICELKVTGPTVDM